MAKRRAAPKPIIAEDPIEAFEGREVKPTRAAKKPAKRLTFPLKVTNATGVEFIVSEKYYTAHKNKLKVVK